MLKTVYGFKWSGVRYVTTESIQLTSEKVKIRYWKK